jgi:nucleoside-diphosphate-sugar epimerase
MRVLVVGSAGFIGSHTVDTLIERGYSVRVMDNLDPQVHPGGGFQTISTGEPSFSERMCETCWADISKIRKALGFKPRYTFPAGLGDVIQRSSAGRPVHTSEKADAELEQHELLS